MCRDKLPLKRSRGARRPTRCRRRFAHPCRVGREAVREPGATWRYIFEMKITEYGTSSTGVQQCHGNFRCSPWRKNSDTYRRSNHRNRFLRGQPACLRRCPHPLRLCLESEGIHHRIRTQRNCKSTNITVWHPLLFRRIRIVVRDSQRVPMVNGVTDRPGAAIAGSTPDVEQMRGPDDTVEGRLI